MKPKVLGLLLFVALGAGAQEVRLSGPVLGFLLERTGAAVRPIYGIPGAATVGGPIQAGLDPDRTSIASPAGYALGVNADSLEVTLLRLLDAPSRVAIENVAPSPDRIVLSPAGAAAALYYEGTRTLQVVTGLPLTPVAHDPIDLSALPGAPAVLAVSDFGESLVVASEDSGESAFLVGPRGSMRYLPVGRVAAAAFFRNSRDLAVAGGDGSLVYRIRGPEISVLAEDVDHPSAIALSADNRTLVVLNAAGGVALIDLAAGVARTVTCKQAVTLERLEGNAIFRLTGTAAKPMLVFDGDAPAPRVVFVPPPPPDEPPGEDESTEGGLQ